MENTNMQERLQGIFEEMRTAATIDELFAIDGLINESDGELAASDDYRKEFDLAEARLNAPAVETPQQPADMLPDDVEQLKKMVRELQSYTFVRDHAKAKKEQPRATVSYRVMRRDVHFKQPQAEAIAQGIIATGKAELTESEVYSLAWKLRNEGVLGGAQSPVRIFKYYLAEGTIGYKSRGFLQKLG